MQYDILSSFQAAFCFRHWKIHTKHFEWQGIILSGIENRHIYGIKTEWDRNVQPRHRTEVNKKIY